MEPFKFPIRTLTKKMTYVIKAITTKFVDNLILWLLNDLFRC